MFCNEDESAEWGKSANLPEGHTVEDIAKDLANFEKSGSRKRVAILTNGPADVVVAEAQEGADPVVTKYPVPQIGDALVDTNGAGDAFVGAFFAELLLGKSLADCIKAGIFFSTEVVKR